MTSALRRLWKAGLAAAIGFAILVGLGSWQLERLSWKEGLIRTVGARMAGDPVPAPGPSEWAKLDLAQWSYRRVIATGVFDRAREARVYTVLSEHRGPLGGPGYFILTPLALADGGTVIVNRGFVPEGRTGTAAPDGTVTVGGLLREPEGRNMFTPADDPSKRLFFDRDPAAIASALGLSAAAPFTIDADASADGGLPQGGETRISFPNRHLEYALTWYGLAATLLAVFLAFAWRTARESPE